MSNVIGINGAKSAPANVAEGLRDIATALENGDLVEPPYALVVFGIANDAPGLEILPVGGRIPGDIEVVGMLTTAATAVSLGEVDKHEIPVG